MKIQPGQILYGQSWSDHTLVYTVEVLKVSRFFATVKDRSGEPYRCKIHTDANGNEYCFAKGIHSLCPSFYPKPEAP